MLFLFYDFCTYIYIFKFSSNFFFQNLCSFFNFIDFLPQVNGTASEINSVDDSIVDILNQNTTSEDATRSIPISRRESIDGIFTIF